MNLRYFGFIKTEFSRFTFIRSLSWASWQTLQSETRASWNSPFIENSHTVTFIQI